MSLPSWSADDVGRVAAPLRNQVLNLVRQAILSFELRPGQRLVERELIEQLGVSRTTVREVIGHLAAEGLVTVVPQKGAIVSVLSMDEAEDIYDMRAALEPIAVRRFIERATPNDRNNLKRAVKEVEKAAKLDELSALAAKDRFYEVLFEGAASPALERTLSTLQGRVRVLRATSLSARERPNAAAAEIRAVVDCIIKGDADAAVAACVTHIRNAAQIALEMLATSEDDPAAQLPIAR